MNRATTTTRAFFYSQAKPSNFKAAFFHSTPVLERKRRNHWNFRHNHYPKRSSKERLFDFDVFSAHLFQSWHNGFDEQGPSSSEENSWFRREHGAKRSRGNYRGQRGANSSGRRAFHFCEDDDDVENIFRSSYGGNRFFYWSFVDENDPRWRSSSNYSNKSKTGWRQMDEEDYDDSSESDGSESILDSDRLVLGLSSSGPLKMEDVKTAYHSCAMKWHPDRHQGASKAVAEEKFKACNVSYQNLRNKLGLN